MRARLIYVLQDTFLDAAHARESFPDSDVEIVNGTAVPGEPKRPFKVAFPPPPAEPEPAAKVRTCERLTNGKPVGKMVRNKVTHAAAFE